MSGGLQQSGIELVAANFSQFQSQLGGATRTAEGFGQAASSAADRAGLSFDQASGRWRNASGQFASDAEKAAAGIATGMQAGGQHVNAFAEIAIGALRRVGEVVVNFAASAAQTLGKFLTDSVTVAGDFEQGMLNFQAVAGKDVDTAGLEKFKDLFISLGKELPVSTAEVQQAATEMVKGGIEPATIAAGGLKQVIQFAAASDLSLAEASTIAAKALGGWVDMAASAQEKADFLAHSTDVMSKAANASTVDVDELAMGLYNVQGTAKLVGQSFDETVTVLAQLAPGFSSAADAGTSYKVFLSRLNPTTKPAIAAMMELGLYTKESGSAFYDAQGNYVGAAKAAELLHKATAGLTNEQREMALQTIFGQDAVRAAAMIAEQGAAGYDKMAGAMDKANGVAANAAIKQQGFNTALENMKGSLEALQITIGSAVLPVLTDLLNKGIAPAINMVTTFADTFAKLAPAIGESSNPIQTFIQVLGIAASSVFPGAGAGLLTLAGAFGSTDTAIGAVWGLLSGFLADIGGKLVGQVQSWAEALGAWILTAMPGMGANLATFAQGLYTAIGAALPPLVAQLATWGAEFVAWLTKAAPIFLTEMGVYVANMLDYLQKNLPAIVSQLATWGAQFVAWLVQAVPPLIAAAGDLLGKLLTWIVASIPGFVSNLEKWGKAFVDWIVKATPGVLTELGNLGKKLFQYVNDLATKAKADGSIGAAIIEGIKSGINAGVESIKTAASNAAKAALAAAKKALGINSPSLVFNEEVGQPMAQGVVVGLKSQEAAIAAAVVDLTKPSRYVGSPSQVASSVSHSTSTTNNFNLGGVITNNSPKVVEQSFAQLAAKAGF